MSSYKQVVVIVLLLSIGSLIFLLLTPQLNDTSAQTAAPLLTIIQVGDDLLLQWDKVPDAVSYRVYRNYPPYITLTTPYNEDSALYFRDTGAAVRKQDHHYVVTAVDLANNESTPSNIVGHAVFGLNGTVVNAPIDLELSKTDNNTVAIPGQDIAYILTYTNSGLATATGVVINETTPENTTFNAAASTAGWQQVSGGDDYTFDIGDLPADAAGTVVFAVTTVDPLPGGIDVITNIANITHDGSQGTDPTLENNSATQETAVSSGPTLVCGPIDNDTTWSATASPYYATCNITVNAGVTLTLAKGTIVKVSDALIINGSLHSQGTANSPVTITSLHDDTVGGDTNNNGNVTSPAPGDWHFIQLFDGADATFDHTNIRYGGGTAGTPGAISARYNNTITLRDSELSASQRVGLWLNSTGGAYTTTLTIERSAISQNWSHGIQMNTGTNGVNNLSITDTTISDNGATGLRLNQVGAFTVTGSTFENNGAYPLYLDSSVVNLSQLHSNSMLGNANNALFLIDNTFPGISVLNAQTPYVLQDNTFPVGSQLQIMPGTVIKIDAAALKIHGSLLAQGTAVNPITITSLHDDTVGGDTNNNGSVTSPAPGDWHFIQLFDGADATFDHTNIRYGGGTAGTPGAISARYNNTITLRDSELSASQRVGLWLNSTGGAYTTTLTIERSAISQNWSHGIQMNAGTNGVNNLSITDTTISDNGATGLRINKIGQSASISNSNIYGNTDYGIYFDNTNPKLIFDARNNYWGTADGPAPYGSGDAINTFEIWDPDCECFVSVTAILFAPWLNSLADMVADDDFEVNLDVK